MNQTSLGPTNGAQKPGPVPEAAAGTGVPEPGGKTSMKYQAVLGPFTSRDLTVFGSTLLMFVGSLLPMFGGRYNLWNLDNLFFLALGIILPVVVTALFVNRRLQPRNVVRIGSLSIDQFASVVASFAVALFFLSAASAFTAYVLVGLIGSVGLLGATVLAPHLPILRDDFKDRAERPAHVVAREAVIPTRKPAVPKPPKPEAAPESPSAAVSDTSAPAEPTIAPTPKWSPASAAPAAAPAAATAAEGAVVEPFVPAEPVEPAAPAESAEPAAPAEVSAVDVGSPHFAATVATPVVAGPNPASGPATQHIGAASQFAQPKVHQSIGATVDPASRRDEDQHGTQYEAFWFAVAHPRTVVDEHTGMTAFTIEPGTWVLALEDRGNEFLVQDADGKTGVLHDLSNIERG